MADPWKPRLWRDEHGKLEKRTVYITLDDIVVAVRLSGMIPEGFSLERQECDTDEVVSSPIGGEQWAVKLVFKRITKDEQP